jgi:hypothetical protein
MMSVAGHLMIIVLALFDSAGQERQNLSFTIGLEKERYLRLEPVIIEVRIRNTSSDTVRIPREIDSFFPLWVGFLDANREKVACVGFQNG